ncbi:hypothetical protein Ddc_13347 [Ditylenchus destructor]|nr:hypothetical protein Ddc_13347 [Ditylenchus destructor]
MFRTYWDPNATLPVAQFTLGAEDTDYCKCVCAGILLPYLLPEYLCLWRRRKRSGQLNNHCFAYNAKEDKIGFSEVKRKKLNI